MEICGHVPPVMARRGLPTQAAMQRRLSMHATGSLALPFPPRTPGSTLVGPPDELRCPNDNIGVADSGGSYDAVGHPELDQASANYRVHRGRNWDLYPTVILAAR